MATKKYEPCNQCETDTHHIKGECQKCGTFQPKKKVVKKRKVAKKPKQKSPPDGCPECKSEDIEFAETLIEGNESSQKCRCLDCNTQWYEVYKYSHRQVI